MQTNEPAAQRQNAVPSWPLRVAVFTEAWAPLVSGVTIATEMLVAGLRARGHHVDVFAPRHPQQPANEPGVCRLPSLSLPIPGWIPLGLPLSPPALKRLAAQRPLYDIVHAQHPFTLGRAARALARRQNAPLVATIHTQYEQYVHYWAPLWPQAGRALIRALLRGYCNSCDAVTTVGEGMAAVLRGYGVTRPIVFIPNELGDATAFFAADPAGVRGELGVKSDDVLLLSVSRLAPEKNLRFLLDALAPLLRAQNKEAPTRLVLVGDGPQRAALEKHASRLGVAGRVLFTGAVSHGRVPRLLAAADLFVLPSVSEVNPLTLREALAAGVPVVAVDSFSARAVLDDGRNGRIVAPEPQAFRAAVADLVARPGVRKQMAAHAQNAARRRELNAPAGATEQTLALYRRLLAARPGRPADPGNKPERGTQPGRP